MSDTNKTAQLERRVNELTHAMDVFQQCQEAEYRSLALDVRDELAPTLNAILFKSRELREQHALPQEAIRTLNDMETMCADAIEEVRRIARMLRPTVLDAKGLIPALEWFCEAAEAQTGIRVVFRHGPGKLHFTKNAELIIYRILREAFNNVYQHTEATLICLDVSYQAGQFTMTISDNGCGFDPDLHTEGVGIVGMRERAMILGGTLEIVSSADNGTRVTLACPLEPVQHDSSDYMEPFFKAGAQILSSVKTPTGETIPLSEREIEVLRYVARGYTCREIGQMLYLSVRTVETYRMRLMHKLGVKNRSELVEYAMKQGIL